LEKAKACLTKEEDTRKTMEFCELAGKNGSAEGWFHLGQLLRTGYPSHPATNPTLKALPNQTRRGLRKLS
jgi:hypothetical protein